MSYLNSVCKCYKDSNFLFVADPKPTWEADVMVVDILTINMYLLCKTLGSLVLGEVLVLSASTLQVTFHRRRIIILLDFNKLIVILKRNG